MRILLNADDFGLSDDTVRATIECFEAGALTSASLMPKMPGTRAAFDFARQRPDLSFGVHLTFVCDSCESPVSDPSEVPALVGGDGLFFPSQKVRLMALFNRIPEAQIEREIAAQLALVRDAGIAVSHVDSHGHLHKFAPFRRALARVLPRFGVRRVRGVQDVYLKKPLRSPTYWLGRLWGRQLAREFVTPTCFYMPSEADAGWTRELLGKVRGDSLEVGVHPGYAEPWRDQQRKDVQAFAAEARRRGHVLCGWKDL